MIHILLFLIYLAYISLGLPDSLLGAAWPVMYPELETNVAFASVIFIIISGGGIISSLFSERLTLKIGTGKVTALSVALTAVSLLGFSMTRSPLLLCLWSIPYGLGAGSVDAALNNYVALYFPSRHMSWLHCMWGVGAAIGPYIMGYVLSGGFHWSRGYQIIGFFQVILLILLLTGLPLWNCHTKALHGQLLETDQMNPTKPLPFTRILKIPGVWEMLLTLLCYCALEQTTILWATSFLTLEKGIDSETAAFFAGLYLTGITAGRALNGFLTLKFNDTQLIRLGFGIITVGLLALLLPFGSIPALAGLVLMGLGSAPIYPCIMHTTPLLFGATHSQAIIGVFMAGAYIGNLFLPSLFGVLADFCGFWIFFLYLAIILIIMIVMHEKIFKKIPAVM